MSGVSIRHTDPSQETATLQKVATDIASILTSSEEILYIALQNRTAISPKKDSAVATTNRIILYKPQILGRFNFSDFHWQDVKDVTLKQGILSSDVVVETVDGRKDSVGNIDKDQARRLYGICQQLEQDWREKRRIRQMEEDRAKAGGVYLTAPAPVAAAPAATVEDPVERLAKLKRMLDQNLISEAEYESVKAKILAEF
ncbi:MAG: PH domain-containing protein [Sphingomonadaceae bacterium]